MVDPIKSSSNGLDDSSDKNGLERSTDTIDTQQAAEQLEMLYQEHVTEMRERQEVGEYGDLERSASLRGARSDGSGSLGSSPGSRPGSDDGLDDDTIVRSSGHSAYEVRSRKEGPGKTERHRPGHAGKFRSSSTSADVPVLQHAVHTRAMSAADQCSTGIPLRRSSSGLGLQLSLHQLPPRPGSRSSSGFWSWPRTRPASSSSIVSLHSGHGYNGSGNSEMSRWDQDLAEDAGINGEDDDLD